MGGIEVEVPVVGRLRTSGLKLRGVSRDGLVLSIKILAVNPNETSDRRLKVQSSLVSSSGHAQCLSRKSDR